jgi:phosphate starvation-inducible protein PhoH and related proteins
MAKRKPVEVVTIPLSLKRIKPLTINQSDTFKAFLRGDHLLLHGVAGTGKTFISLSLALGMVLPTPIQDSPPFDKVIVVRSVVPSREIGFMPGTLKEKIAVYEDPYRDICNDLLERADGYELLKGRGYLKFTTTSYLRGITFSDAIVIVDEIQNMSYHELHTVMTRLGKHCRIIFCGDYRQSDLQRHDGLGHFMEILRDMGKFCCMEFGNNDIVRDDLVKEFLIAESSYRERCPF